MLKVPFVDALWQQKIKIVLRLLTDTIGIRGVVQWVTRVGALGAAIVWRGMPVWLTSVESVKFSSAFESIKVMRWRWRGTSERTPPHTLLINFLFWLLRTGDEEIALISHSRCSDVSQCGAAAQKELGELTHLHSFLSWLGTCWHRGGVSGTGRHVCKGHDWE